jgi:hypothetical protein
LTNEEEEEEVCYRADTQLRCNEPLEIGIAARLTIIIIIIMSLLQ